LSCLQTDEQTRTLSPISTAHQNPARDCSVSTQNAAMSIVFIGRSCCGNYGKMPAARLYYRMVSCSRRLQYLVGTKTAHLRRRPVISTANLVAPSRRLFTKDIALRRRRRAEVVRRALFQPTTTQRDSAGMLLTHNLSLPIKLQATIFCPGFDIEWLRQCAVRQ